MLNGEIEAQVRELAAQYGEPQRVHAELRSQLFSPISESDRYGEVCMVIRRPNGRLISAIKTFYPAGAHRLLTGGINHGEAIETALLREVWEETGLEVAVARFLAVIEYWLADHERANDEPRFATFAFLLDERGGVLAPHDPNERLAEYRELTVEELPVVARTLANIGAGYDDEIGGRWSEWGQFRAVVHEAVYEALRPST